MKSLIYIIFFVFAATLLSADDYVAGRLIVKFKPGSQHSYKWLESGRSGEIAEFTAILGEHTLRPFVEDNLLKALSKAKSKSKKKSASNIERRLDLIAVIDYTGNINPEIAARKIAAMGNVEYAEPETIKRISEEFPNDTLFSQQYYLEIIKALKAWELLGNADTVIIGIVDTGVEFAHADLADNIFLNQGEIGLDEQGNDKRTNGIDDDGNGFIDDWRGWDFFGSGDNDPSPGHLHGTHVAGICGAVINNITGIAGTAPNVKLLAVKIAYDSQFATSIVNGYQGLLYAATMGCGVINCSWGSSSYSQSDAEMVAEAISLGSLIVAAAGNDRRDQAQYPASYPGVISVAATNIDDHAASFTNYHRSVDISAPGIAILSTVPIGDYRNLDGTSMASPIAAAVAAMMRGKYPKLSALQIGELMKATADPIDSINLFYKGKLGRGRVNAERALSNEKAVSILLNSIAIVEEIPDGEFNEGEKIEVTFSLLNVLDSAKNIAVKIFPSESGIFTSIKDSIYIGDLSTMQYSFPDDKFSLKINSGIGLDKKVDLVFVVSAHGGFLSEDAVSLTVSPSYKSMRSNNIHTTFNSIGNIAYNDYPTNAQGIGFLYKNSPNILFEGALMIGVENKQIYNTARSSSQMTKDFTLTSNIAFRTEKPGQLAAEEGFAFFNNLKPDFSSNISVTQHVFQFDEPHLANIIFPIYTLHNSRTVDIDSVFAGYYFDWDIGAPGRNYIWWDSLNNIGFAKNVDTDTLPIAAAVLLSDLPVNFFAMDNNGNSEENPGVYDGFTPAEKLMVISRGIGRAESAITDASMVIAGGPMKIKSKDSVKIAFAILSGYSEEQIIADAINARKHSDFTGISLNYGDKPARNNSILTVYPNPAKDDITVKLSVSGDYEFDLALYDLLGRKIKTLAKNQKPSYGRHSYRFDVSDLFAGEYFVVLIHNGLRSAYPIIIQ